MFNIQYSIRFYLSRFFWYNNLMNQAQITQTVNNAEELFKIIMKLYWTYLSSLEEYIKSIPETEKDILNELYQHMQDVQGALEHDISVFDKAIQSDLEDLNQLQDKLKIDLIYQKLQQK